MQSIVKIIESLGHTPTPVDGPYETSRKKLLAKFDEETDLRLTPIYEELPIFSSEVKVLGKGDTITQLGTMKNTEGLTKLLTNPYLVTYLTPDRISKLRRSFTLYPVKSIRNQYVNVVGFDPIGDSYKLISWNGQLNLLGDEIIYIYTNNTNNVFAAINYLLSLGILMNDYGIYCRYLKACVYAQTPKWSGKSYRGLLASSMLAFNFLRKKKFYLPAFTSTSTSLEGFYFNCYPDDENKDPEKSYQNMILEIDSSEYCLSSTIVKNHQTPFVNECENLFACNTVYEVVGIKRVSFQRNNVNVKDCLCICLKVLDSEKETNPNVNELYGRTNETAEYIEWLRKRSGEMVTTAEVTPSVLIHNLRLTVDSFNRYMPENIRINEFDLKKDPQPLVPVNTTVECRNTVCVVEHNYVDRSETHYKEGLDSIYGNMKSSSTYMKVESGAPLTTVQDSESTDLFIDHTGRTIRVVHGFASDYSDCTMNVEDYGCHGVERYSIEQPFLDMYGNVVSVAN